MNAKRPAEARREEAPGGRHSKRSHPRRQSTATTWTDADEAELDVLLWALSFDYFEHRERCPACRCASIRGVHISRTGGDIRPDPCPVLEAWLAHKDDCRICELAPLTFGWDCPQRRRFLDEHHDCARCLPCPQLVAAIAVVTRLA